MNIFFLSRDPETCAHYHCDKHAVKMVCEYAQLLSTAHHVLDGRASVHACKKTHQNHPSAIWARASVEHYLWLFDLYVCVSAEYTHRYGRSHGAAKPERVRALARPPRRIEHAGWCDPPQCMPEELRSGLAVFAYRRYYMRDKRRMLVWKNRPVPQWARAGIAATPRPPQTSRPTRAETR